MGWLEVLERAERKKKETTTHNTPPSKRHVTKDVPQKAVVVGTDNTDKRTDGGRGDLSADEMAHRKRHRATHDEAKAWADYDRKVLATMERLEPCHHGTLGGCWLCHKQGRKPTPGSDVWEIQEKGEE